MERVPLRRVGAALRAGGGATNRAGKPPTRSHAACRHGSSHRHHAGRPAGVPDPLCLSEPF